MEKNRNATSIQSRTEKRSQVPNDSLTSILLSVSGLVSFLPSVSGLVSFLPSVPGLDSFLPSAFGNYRVRNDAPKYRVAQMLQILVMHVSNF